MLKNDQRAKDHFSDEKNDIFCHKLKKTIIYYLLQLFVTETQLTLDVSSSLLSCYNKKTPVQQVILTTL